MEHYERSQHVYDHRLRELVRHTGDVTIATNLGVPRSTVAGWLGATSRPVISLDVVEMSDVVLQAEVVKLRHRVQTLSGILGLLLAVLRVSGFRLDQAYISDPGARDDLLRAIERARKILPVGAVLRILRVSAARYHLWLQAKRGCAIEGRTTCPKSAPNQLTPEEVAVIGRMAMAERYRHIPTGHLGPANGQGLRLCIDLVQTRARSRMGATEKTAAPSQSEGWCASQQARRNLAYRCVLRAPGRWYEGLVVCRHRQLQSQDPGLVRL